MDELPIVKRLREEAILCKEHGPDDVARLLTQAADLITELTEALREIGASTARKQLPLTAQINQMAIDALAKVTETPEVETP